MERSPGPPTRRACWMSQQSRRTHRHPETAPPGERERGDGAAGALLELTGADIDCDAGLVRVRRQLDHARMTRVEPKTPQEDGKRRWRSALRWHDLRHTYAEHPGRARANVVFVSRQLGHASPDITLKVYAHLFDHAEHAKRTSDALEARFGAIL